MDLSPFKIDIDELINEFAENELTTFADMKKIWIRRRFSYIFECQPPTNLALFMQTLYNHSVNHLISNNKSISHRVGSLYCLYCLYETQPFKPPFKIYLSLGGLQGLMSLVVVAKNMGIGAVSAIVKRMLENNVFLFGSVDINDYSEKEGIKELVNGHNACIKRMHEKLLKSTDVERYLHMDLGMELDLEMLTKISAEYAGCKSIAIEEASKMVDVEDIRHLAEDIANVGNEVAKINEEWETQKESISQLTASETRYPEQESEQLMLVPATDQDDVHDDYMDDDDFDFAMELECQLFED